MYVCEKWVFTHVFTSVYVHEIFTCAYEVRGACRHNTAFTMHTCALHAIFNNMYAYKCIYLYVCMYICVYTILCIYTCIYIYVYIAEPALRILSKHAYIHIFIHTYAFIYVHAHNFQAYVMGSVEMFASCDDIEPLEGMCVQFTEKSSQGPVVQVAQVLVCYMSILYVCMYVCIHTCMMCPCVCIYM
jgi:hypothetical protein